MIDPQVKQEIRALQEEVRRLWLRTPLQDMSPDWDVSAASGVKLAKITTDNADGTYDVDEEGGSWGLEDIKIWEAQDVDFFNGLGVGEYVVCVQEWDETWWITVGWANLRSD